MNSLRLSRTERSNTDHASTAQHWYGERETTWGWFGDGLYGNGPRIVLRQRVRRREDRRHVPIFTDAEEYEVEYRRTSKNVFEAPGIRRRRIVEARRAARDHRVNASTTEDV